MSWMELSVEAEAEAVESVSELLAQYGYNGGIAIDQPVIPGLDGPEYTLDTARAVVVRTYIPLDEHAEDVRSKVEQSLWFLGMMRQIGPLVVRPLDEQDWANAWKRYYTIQRIGERCVIVPSWLTYAPQPQDLVIALDPGMAFGTGLHPTTRLCVGLLEEHVTRSTRVLDLGCGSGVLAIAASLLGAAEVLALDTDHVAVEATRENAAHNGLADKIVVTAGSLGAGANFGHWLGAAAEGTPAASEAVDAGRFDLIVANIIARVHVALAQDYVDALHPGGVLVLSGIIAERETEVLDALAAVALTRIDRRVEGEWVALAYRR